MEKGLKITTWTFFILAIVLGIVRFVNEIKVVPISRTVSINVASGFWILLVLSIIGFLSFSQDRKKK